MSDRTPSDDEIIAAERRRYRRNIRLVVPVFILLCIAFAGGAGYALHAGLIREWQFLAALFVPGTLLAVWILRQRVAHPEALRPGVLRRQIDTFQRRERISLLAFCLVLISFGYSLQHSFVSGHTPPHFSLIDSFNRWFLPATFLYVALLVAGIVDYGISLGSKRGRPLRDEMIEALHGRAAKFGFLAAVLGLGAAYFIALFLPEMSLRLLPPIIAAVVAIPAMFYVAIEWRAGRGDAR